MTPGERNERYAVFDDPPQPEVAVWHYAMDNNRITSRIRGNGP